MIKHLRDVRTAINKIGHRAVAFVAVGAHASYYGLVSLEAHGFYRYAAAVILILMAINLLSGHSEEAP